MGIRRNSARGANFSESGDFIIRIGEPGGTWPIVTLVTVLGRRVFDATPEAVAEARRWLRSVVGDGDAQECLSEVCTNSVRHSRSADCGEGVSVLVLGIRSTIRVEVTDAGGPTQPRLLPLNEDATSGRGLYLVNELTSGRWGWHNNPGSRTVWFELPRTEL